jgi:hypothetical protein
MTRQLPESAAVPVAAERRRFLTVCSAFGMTTTLFPGVLWGQLQDGVGKVTREMIDHAAAVAGVEVSDANKDAMLEALNDQVEASTKSASCAWKTRPRRHCCSTP